MKILRRFEFEPSQVLMSGLIAKQYSPTQGTYHSTSPQPDASANGTMSQPSKQIRTPWLNPQSDSQQYPKSDSQQHPKSDSQQHPKSDSQVNALSELQVFLRGPVTELMMFVDDPNKVQPLVSQVSPAILTALPIAINWYALAACYTVVRYPALNILTDLLCAQTHILYTLASTLLHPASISSCIPQRYNGCARQPM